MRTVLIITAALLLSACAVFDTIAPQIASKGAAANDKGLAAAEWALCNAASVGSVRRRYGASVELADAWRRLCSIDKGEIIGGR